MTREEDLDETPIRSAHDAGDLARAATLTLEAYGDEIARFLLALLRSEQEAEEVFAQFTENLWKGLPNFEWRNTMRSWAYTVARHAAIRHKTVAYRKPGRNIPLSDATHLSKVVDAIRTRTAIHLRTETKSKIRELREQLPADDQTLIILRVDRGMSWAELAEVLRAEDGSAEDPKREQARLRKRFQLAKDRLKELAREAGLIEG